MGEKNAALGLILINICWIVYYLNPLVESYSSYQNKITNFETLPDDQDENPLYAIDKRACMHSEDPNECFKQY